MTHPTEPSFWKLLAQTLLIAVGGFLFVNLLVTTAEMSPVQWLLGQLSVGLLWFGLVTPHGK